MGFPNYLFNLRGGGFITMCTEWLKSRDDTTANKIIMHLIQSQQQIVLKETNVISQLGRMLQV